VLSDTYDIVIFFYFYVMRFLLFLLMLSFSVQVFAQSKAELEARRKEIMEAIEETQQQLEITKKDKNATIGQLRALQNKLAERQRLISNINSEIGNIDQNIKSSSNEISVLQANLEQLKMRYAQSVRYAYQGRSSYDLLVYVFSAEDFNEAMRRMKYLKKYREYQEQQVAQIRKTEDQIKNKIGVLNVEKQQKDMLLTDQVQQKQVLQQETSETDKVVKELKGKEKQLLAEIERNKKIVTRVNKAIQQVIQREIELAREKAEQEQKKKPTNATANTGGGTKRKVEVANAAPLLSTPEAIALSNNFESNRGKLPWPVEKGFVSDHFGLHPHPIAKDVIMDNKGVDIRTSAGAGARAVFEGTVSTAMYINGGGWTVMVNHGNFFTVYSGLQSVSVKTNQKVSTKQALGVVGANDYGEPTMHFEIWKVGKGSTALNPEAWIAR
jgi:murein hydrolase activator